MDAPDDDTRRKTTVEAHSPRVIGVDSGYVGTVVASCFAWIRHDSVGLEADPKMLRALAAGRVPFYEPGLQEFLAAGLRSDRLRFTDDYADARTGADAVSLCVGTSSAHDGSVDMRAI
jgi:UDPglucose 6-dehydrogenase